MDAHTGEQEQSSSATTEKRSGKRRLRISRACDECRARKTKCDGHQPCGTCEAFDRHCSYHLNLGRLGTVQRSKILEDRLRRAHTHIKELQQKLPQSAHVDPDALFGFPPDVPREESEEKANDSDESHHLEYLVDGQGQMNSARGKSPATFYGCNSGFAFLAKTNAFLSRDSDDSDESDNFDAEGDKDEEAKEDVLRASGITELFDSPLPSKQALDLGGPISHLLPLRDTARSLSRTVFDEAYPLYQFMATETFDERTDRIYTLEPFEFDQEDHAFLPLFYAVIAIGLLFSQKEHRKHGCERATFQAMRHFIAARHMLDITRCQDIVSLQTLICFVLFLMSTARIATAHTYVGIAVTSALRLGLHCSLVSNDSFTDRERSMRRRVFWTIVKVDLYTSSILGLPPLTNPLEFEMTSDERIQKVIDDARTNSSDFLQEKLPMMASAKHMQLMKITCKMMQTLYARSHYDAKTNEYPRLTISNAKVESLANELESWRESTAKLLREEFNDGPIARTIKYDLDMAEAFASIVLCRPFLHYLGYKADDDTTHAAKLRWANVCVHAAQNAIQKSVGMLEQGNLAPASWHAMYTIFMSIVSLVFFLATRKNASEGQHVHHIAVDGIRILSTTVCRDTGSEKCLKVLQGLTKRLSPRMELDVEKISADTSPLCKQDHAVAQKFSVAQHSATEQQSYEPQQNSSQSAATLSANPGIQPLWQQANLPHFSRSHEQPGSQSQSNLSNNEQAQYPVSMPFDLDAMHMPFAETFNWPHSQFSAQSGMDASTVYSSSSMPSSHYPLSIDDIDEFMFNNP